jgi:hypothetical protein
MTKEERSAHCKRIGALGGRATVEKHGPSYMSRMGKKGFAGLVRRFGDDGAAVSFLQSHRGMNKLPRKAWSHGIAYVKD